MLDAGSSHFIAGCPQITQMDTDSIAIAIDGWLETGWRDDRYHRIASLHHAEKPQIAQIAQIDADIVAAIAVWTRISRMTRIFRIRLLADLDHINLFEANRPVNLIDQGPMRLGSRDRS